MGALLELLHVDHIAGFQRVVEAGECVEEADLSFTEARDYFLDQHLAPLVCLHIGVGLLLEGRLVFGVLCLALQPLSLAFHEEHRLLLLLFINLLLTHLSDHLDQRLLEVVYLD